MMNVVWVLLTLSVLGCVKREVVGSVVADLSHVNEQISDNGSDCINFECNGHLAKRIKTALIFSDENGQNNQHSNCPKPSCQPITADQLLGDSFVKLGNKYYYFSPDAKSWHNALLACQSKGAQLAHPLNAEENNNLKSYLRSHFLKTSWWWLDGNDAAQEGKWMWSYNNSPITFTDWYKTEPDNNVEASNCLIYWEVDGWKWGDADCPAARRYICQTQPKPCCSVS
ncbi:chromatin-modulating protein mrc1 [Chamberlinius hualienensis]